MCIDQLARVAFPCGEDTKKMNVGLSYPAFSFQGRGVADAADRTAHLINIPDRCILLISRVMFVADKMS
jgi:hypothetical protein